MAVIFFDSPRAGDTVGGATTSFQANGHLDAGFPGPGVVKMKAWVSFNGNATEGAPVALPSGNSVAWSFQMSIPPGANGQSIWLTVLVFPPDNSQPSSAAIQLTVGPVINPGGNGASLAKQQEL